jgi:addiction module HigA family antidote
MMMYNPPHPGEFIIETYIIPLNISLRSAAEKLDVSPSTFSRLIKGNADVSPIMALKLSKAFGRSPESWMLMQAEHELWEEYIVEFVDISGVEIEYYISNYEDVDKD